MSSNSIDAGYKTKEKISFTKDGSQFTKEYIRFKMKKILPCYHPV